MPRRLLPAIFMTLTILFFAQTGFASWSVNIGWHNPPAASLGVNVLKDFGYVGLEAGTGYFRLGNDDDDTNLSENKNAFILVGAANLKFFYPMSFGRPYLQVGADWRFGGEVSRESSLGVSSGKPYGGLGVLIGNTSSFYGYSSVNIGNKKIFGQIGLGLGI